MIDAEPGADDVEAAVDETGWAKLEETAADVESDNEALDTSDDHVDGLESTLAVDELKTLFMDCDDIPSDVADKEVERSFCEPVVGRLEVDDDCT